MDIELYKLSKEYIKNNNNRFFKTINFSTLSEQQQIILLEECSRNNRLEMIEHLFSVIKFRDFGKSISIACLYGNIKIVQFFIEKEAQITEDHFICANWNKHTDIIEFLTKNKKG